MNIGMKRRMIEVRYRKEEIVMGKWKGGIRFCGRFRNEMFDGESRV